MTMIHRSLHGTPSVHDEPKKSVARLFYFFSVTLSALSLGSLCVVLACRYFLNLPLASYLHESLGVMCFVSLCFFAVCSLWIRRSEEPDPLDAHDIAKLAMEEALDDEATDAKIAEVLKQDEERKAQLQLQKKNKLAQRIKR